LLFENERKEVHGYFSPAIRCSPDEESGAAAAVGFRNNISALMH